MKQEDLWELRIKNVEEKDSGLFECQVNTFIKALKVYVCIFRKVLVGCPTRLSSIFQHPKNREI